MPALVSALSLIDEQNGRRVRMGSLAFIGSHRVNGVSALHTELMRQTVFRDLNELYPDRIVNKTNGITFRRWLFEANPGLTRLLVDVVGEKVLDDPRALEILAKSAGDTALHDRLIAVRRANKEALADRIAEYTADPHRPGRDVRRPDQAHPRIQAPAAQHPRNRGALSVDARCTRRATGCRGSRSSPARRRAATTAPS